MRLERFDDKEALQLAWELTRKVYSLTKKTKFVCDFGLKGPIQAKSTNESKPGTVNAEPVNA
jgi:hypothetical protein